MKSVLCFAAVNDFMYIDTVIGPVLLIVKSHGVAFFGRRVAEIRQGRN
jgi:hypothetical protein